MKQEQYSFSEVLGTGAFGVTYLAGTGEDGRVCAVKKSFQQTEGFMEKMNLLASKEIPGLVKIYDYFQEDDSDFLVMEYLSGGTLKARLAREPFKNKDYKTVLKMLVPVMEGLSVLHSYGMLHLDVSPDNLMFDERQQCRLIDFGTVRSKNLPADDRPLKEGYGAPELYSSPQLAGPWTDVYSLCAVLYEIFTGQRVPPAPSRMKKDTLEPVSAYLRLPAAVEAAIHRGLEPEIQKRFFSVENLMQHLNLPVDKIQSYSPEMRRQWGSLWIEISARGSFFKTETPGKRNALLSGLKKSAAVFGICCTLFLGGYQITASVHPEWIFAFQLKMARAYRSFVQASGPDVYVLSELSPDYEECLDYLKSHGRQEDDAGTEKSSGTVYYTMTEEDYKNWDCRPNCYKKMYLDWKTLKKISAYYLDMDKLEASKGTNEEQSWNDRISVSGDYPGEITIRCCKEKSYSFTEEGTDYHFTFVYDPLDDRAYSVTCRTQNREVIGRFLTEILPWCCPEAGLTEAEAEELLSQCETDDSKTFQLCLNEKAWIGLISFSNGDEPLTYSLTVSPSARGLGL